MLIMFIRTFLLYVLLMITIRLMGKHQIGQLQPYELVIAIIISDLASIPMQDVDVPLLSGVIPILTLLFVQVSVSLFSLRCPNFRKLVSGAPSLLIEHGKIQEDTMADLRYSLNDLMEQLRLKDIPNIADVEYAILETSGKLSVIPKIQKRTVSVEDLQLSPEDSGLPISLVEDGRLNPRNMQISQTSESELLKQLNTQGIPDYQNALLVSKDALGNFFIQGKQQKKKKR